MVDGCWVGLCCGLLWVFNGENGDYLIGFYLLCVCVYVAIVGVRVEYCNVPCVLFQC